MFNTNETKFGFGGTLGPQPFVTMGANRVMGLRLQRTHGPFWGSRAYWA